jgi:hypothetical protein
MFPGEGGEIQTLYTPHPHTTVGYGSTGGTLWSPVYPTQVGFESLELGVYHRLEFTDRPSSCIYCKLVLKKNKKSNLRCKYNIN